MVRVFLRLILLAMLLASCTAPATPLPPTPTNFPTPQPTMTATPVPQAFRIVAYATDGVVESVIPYDKLTHINFAFLTPNADGTFAPLLNDYKLRQIVGHAHQYNVKVLISVGGWGWDQQFETVAADPSLRSAFIQNLRAIIDNFQFDGADIDWEYPDAGQSAQNYLALIQELRKALPDKELTTAVVVSGDNAQGILPETFASFDFVNVMAYDGPDHGTLEQFNQGLAFWTKQGLPKEKMVMGIPFYGDPDMPYRKLVQDDPAAAQTDTFEYFGKAYHYNGIPTVQAKTKLAMQQAGGVMFWNLDDDAVGEFSLVNAIYQTVHS
jgi:GH18 family chitinase